MNGLIRKIGLALLVLVTWNQLEAQRPGFPKDPSRMVQREKQMVLSEVEGLNDSQKEEIMILYDALSLEIDKKISDAETARKDQRKEMRNNINERLKETFSQEQYDQYLKLLAERRGNQRKRRHKGD